MLNRRLYLQLIILVTAALLASAGCARDEASSPTPPAVPTPENAWAATLLLMPYPFTAPLPAGETSPLDGLYGKLDPREEQRTPCRRCAPYPPKGGEWLLQLENGVFHVLHELSGWRAVGSFTVLGDQVEFFNDPHCVNAVGSYTWTLQEGQLVLEVIRDPCAGYLRAQSLTHLPWTLEE